MTWLKSMYIKFPDSTAEFTSTIGFISTEKIGLGRSDDVYL